MSGAHDAIRVHIHKQAVKESRDCGFEPEALAVVFADSWKRLRDTPGTKLRRLSSTPGNDFRLRIGDRHRAVASVAHDASGRLSAYIHDVAPRREVYERDTIWARLKRFWGSGGGKSKQPSHADMAAHYRYLDPAQATQSRIPKASLDFFLQLQQQEFFDRVLPLLTYERSNEVELVIGHGPPGSGKTLVACNLALEACLDGHDVDVLVPSVGLENEYERLLKSWDVLAEPGGAASDGVRVWRYPSFFAHVAGVRLPFDRESRVRAWWHEVLSEPAWRASIGQKRIGTSGITDLDIAERMPVLIDALLEDDAFWADDHAVARTKDRMATVFDNFRRILGGCRESLLERLDSAQHAHENAVITRAGVATLPAVESSWRSHEHEDTERPRLLIVDEAQDLAPGEWRRLLDLWFENGPAKRPVPGRLVLLGDLDQRVSLVPFHWDDVKAYAIGSLKVPVARIEERQVDAASYRMRRNVAVFASAVYDKRVVDQAKVRRHGRIDYEKLLIGGTVDVAVVDRRNLDVAEVLAAGAEQRVAGEYLFVIHGGATDLADVPPRNDVFLYSVRSAKGLEADRVIVVHPFEARQSHKPAPVTPDEAAEYYTAVSRAREHVLLVIDEASSALLTPAVDAWSVATIHHIGADRDRLRGLVEECRIALSDDEVRNELVRQLNQITTQPGEFRESAGQRIQAILSRLAENPDEDLSLALIQAGEQLASTDLTLYTQVRENARRELAAAHRATAIATLLFAGEVGLATRVLGAMTPAEAVAWNPEWLEMVAAESCWQAWRDGTDPLDDGLVWTPDLLERKVYDRTIDRIRGIVKNLQRSEGS